MQIFPPAFCLCLIWVKYSTIVGAFFTLIKGFIVLRCSKYGFALIVLSMLFSISATSAMARDIGNEQRAASEARERYNLAVSNDASLSKQVAEQEKRVATEQAHLKELQDKQAQNKALIESAKTDLDAKVQTLESVWEDRNKN